jgi:CRP-like cAMP-binding protein
LLVEKPYPASAVANEDTLLIKISKLEFIKILKDYPKINFQFTKILAKIIYNYSLIAKAISANKTEGKVLTILKIHKENCGDQGIKNFKIELSRQQIADMTGLRVETVIRTIKKLENKNVLKIEKGKIYM